MCKLKGKKASIEAIQAACGAIRNLSARRQAQVLLVEAGMCEAFGLVMESNERYIAHAGIMTQVCGAVENLTAHTMSQRLASAGVLKGLVSVLCELRHVRVVIRQVCAALEKICFTGTPQIIAMFGDVGACEAMVQVMLEYIGDEKIARLACSIVYYLAHGDPVNTLRLCDAGACEVLARVRIKYKGGLRFDGSPLNDIQHLTRRRWEAEHL